MKDKKNGARGKSSLSSLAAGLSTGGRSAPVNPLVAALARKGAAQRITAGLMAKTVGMPVRSGVSGRSVFPERPAGLRMPIKVVAPMKFAGAAATRVVAHKVAAQSATQQGATDSAAQKVATEKIAADRAAQKVAAQKSEAKKVAAESAAQKVAVQRVAASKVAAAKIAAEKIAGQKAAAEKAAAAKIAAERIAGQKAAAQKLSSEKIAAQKNAAQKVVAEKRVAQRVAAENVAAQKLSARIAATQKAKPTNSFAPTQPARGVTTPGSQPQSRPGPSSGVAPGLAGTSRTAASVAGLVKSATESRAAPKKGGAPAEHRRQYPRAELQVQARLSLADDPSHNFEASLATSNVSVGGLFLASTFFLKMGTKLEVRLSLPPHGREVHVKAQVVRVDSTDEKHSGFALRFTDYLDGSEVVLATHFLSPVLRDFISQYALGNGFKPTNEYLSHTADVLAAWELRRAALGGDVWVVPGDR